MKFHKNMLLLYAVTDRSWIGKQTLYEQVEDALKGGATIVQLREKTLAKEEFVREAIEIKELCHRYHVPLIINDDVDVFQRSEKKSLPTLSSVPLAKLWSRQRRHKGQEQIIWA